MSQNTFGNYMTALRFAAGLTLEQVAQEMGISGAVVSAWEDGTAQPELSQLPLLADCLNTTLDALFGRTPPSNTLPWQDTNEVHAVCFLGHRLVNHALVLPDDRARKIVLQYIGNAGNVYSDFSVSFRNSTISGDVHVQGDLFGDVQCDRTVGCGGSITGSVTAGGDVGCRGITGDLRAEGDVTCYGTVTGNVTAMGNIECADIGGNAAALGDILCGTPSGTSWAKTEWME